MANTNDTLLLDAELVRAIMTKKKMSVKDLGRQLSAGGKEVAALCDGKLPKPASGLYQRAQRFQDRGLEQYPALLDTYYQKHPNAKPAPTSAPKALDAETLDEQIARMEAELDSDEMNRAREAADKLAQAKANLARAKAKAAEEREAARAAEMARRRQWTPDELREVRINLGLSEGALAQRVGATAPAVIEWEAGCGLPELAHVDAIAQLMEEATQPSDGGDAFYHLLAQVLAHTRWSREELGRCLRVSTNSVNNWLRHTPPRDHVRRRVVPLLEAVLAAPAPQITPRDWADFDALRTELGVGLAKWVTGRKLTEDLGLNSSIIARSLIRHLQNLYFTHHDDGKRQY